MEAMLGDLLDALDRYYPAGFSLEMLKKNFNPKMLEEALEGGAIKEREIKGKKTGDVVLTITGYTILNQIRLKKATDKLDHSINIFNQSSEIYSFTIIMLTCILITIGILQIILVVSNLTARIILASSLILVVGSIMWIFRRKDKKETSGDFLHRRH